MAFLPSNIKAPSEGGGGAGNYMRFQQGDNKFRIIGSSDDKPTPGFICGTLGWAVVDGKKRPIRWAEGAEAPQAFDDKPRSFYAFVVYNYAESKVQILEMTQTKLQSNGEGLETTYAMNPKPIKKLDEDLRAIVKAELKAINLPALFEGEDPFAAFEPPVEEDEDEVPY